MIRLSNTAQSHGSISPADWDLLFHAVQERLENCVSDALNKSPKLEPSDRHEVTKAAVLECVESMQRLHVALTLERQKKPNKPAKTKALKTTSDFYQAQLRPEAAPSVRGTAQQPATQVRD